MAQTFSRGLLILSAMSLKSAALFGKSRPFCSSVSLWTQNHQKYGRSGMGTPYILPLINVLFQARVGMAARFGYSRIASPARYGVRSMHLASRKAGTIGVDG